MNERKMFGNENLKIWLKYPNFNKREMNYEIIEGGSI